jgi:hypothetical protein
VPTTYRIDVIDNAGVRSGRDTFATSSASVYAAGRILDGGNIQSDWPLQGAPFIRCRPTRA